MLKKLIYCHMIFLLSSMYASEQNRLDILYKKRDYYSEEITSAPEKKVNIFLFDKLLYCKQQVTDKYEAYSQILNGLSSDISTIEKYLKVLSSDDSDSGDSEDITILEVILPAKE